MDKMTLILVRMRLQEDQQGALDALAEVGSKYPEALTPVATEIIGMVYGRAITVVGNMLIEEVLKDEKS